MQHRYFSILLFSILSFISCLLSFSSEAFSQELTDQEAPAILLTDPLNVEAHEPKLPLWEAGIFSTGLTHPAYPGADDQVMRVLALPFAIYRGKYLRIDRGTVGVRAIKTPRTEVDVGFSASLGSRSADVDARRDMDDLGTLIGFGQRLKINLGDVSTGKVDSKIQIGVRGVLDLDDHFSYRGLAFEPQWINAIHLLSGWDTTTNFSAILGDQQLVDTYYRVKPDEATATRPAYAAKSGLISLRVGVLATRLLTHDVRFFSYVQFDTVAGAANHSSPLVRRDSGWSAVVGFAWTLSRSERAASD